MTDLELTKLCADAMGYKAEPHPNRILGTKLMWVANNGNWNPLIDDAQAMALVKKFVLRINRNRGMPEKWAVNSRRNYEDIQLSDDLNRAICQCVANMQKAKP